MDYPGNLFVIAAPSGAGKSSLVNALMEVDGLVQPSVSHTTRAPRGQEKNGREYHFISNAQFDEMVANNAFLEWAHVHNNRYGTSKKEIEAKIANGTDLVLEIDITSRTYLDNYRQLGVPELWRYTQSGLQINLLQEGEYIESLSSPNFPQIPIIELINQFVKQSQQLGRSEAIRNFKNWLTENIDNS